jgi:hypothetical protein
VRALEHLARERVQRTLGGLVARIVDERAPLRVRLVGLRHRGLAEGELLAVQRHRESRLAPCELRRLGLRGLADVALHGEEQQLAVAGLAQRIDGRAREQAGVPVVDGLDLEPVLAAGVVQQVLADEGLGERLRLGAIGGQVHGVPA